MISPAYSQGRCFFNYAPEPIWTGYDVNRYIFLPAARSVCDRFRGEGMGQQIALPQFTPQGFQPFQLFGGFDAFGDRSQLQLVTQAHYGLDNLVVFIARLPYCLQTTGQF